MASVYDEFGHRFWFQFGIPLTSKSKLFHNRLWDDYLKKKYDFLRKKDPILHKSGVPKWIRFRPCSIGGGIIRWLTLTLVGYPSDSIWVVLVTLISISMDLFPLRLRQHPQGKQDKTIHAHYITAMQPNKIVLRNMN